MLSAVILLVTLSTAFGHGVAADKMDDADLQAGLMPQELNPAFVSEKDGPWKYVMPLTSRLRRSNSEETPSPSSIDLVKSYKLQNGSQSAWEQPGDNDGPVQSLVGTAVGLKMADGNAITALTKLSRVVAAVVLVISAIVELVVYFLE